INGAQFVVSTGILHIDDGQPWRISEQGRDDWLEKVKSKTYCYFEDITKSKVGVKTTADKVFIKKDWENEEPELAVPLITHHIAARYKAGKPTRKILYPYDMGNNKKVPLDISKYPKTEKYLEQHREQLEGRKYVIEAGRKWYEIWVPHKPSEWKYPKIVFRDISERPTFWADFSGDIVNGDCYWMSFKDKDEDYLWLTLAVANSSFIEKYYDYKFNNKLYSGRRRFITQYVSRFPLPNPTSDISKRIIKLSKSIYETNSTEEKEAQEVEVDALVWEAFDAS
ncbi:MAG: TaqI-like C-terminal specificity domain-containing protein, partial [Candidatus Saccharimonadales bacterium]